MKALVSAFNPEKALVGAFSVIVQPVVEPMDRFTALPLIVCDVSNCYPACVIFNCVLSVCLTVYCQASKCVKIRMDDKER